jgi:hypothetical protein
MCTYSGEWRISGGDGIAGAQLTGDRQKCWFVEGVAFGEKQSCVFAAILILEAFAASISPTPLRAAGLKLIVSY